MHNAVRTAHCATETLTCFHISMFFIFTIFHFFIFFRFVIFSVFPFFSFSHFSTFSFLSFFISLPLTKTSLFSYRNLIFWHDSG